MCGRFACSLCPYELRTTLRSSDVAVSDKWNDEDYFHPSYNVAPRKWIPVVRYADNNDLILQTMKWGFIPSWAKHTPDNQPINARDETLSVGHSMFDHAKNKGRCIVVAEGFFEWKKLTEKKKIPYYTKRKDGKLMLFAGLYDHSNIDGQSLYTCTIVTTSPSKFFSFLHDRMPVILENGSPEVEKWLSSEPWGKDISKIMKPYEGELDCYQVTDAVGPTTNNSSDFVVPVDQLKGSISNFFSKSSTTPATKKPHPSASTTKSKEQEKPITPSKRSADKDTQEDPIKKKLKSTQAATTTTDKSKNKKKITSFFTKQ
ncbi:duf159 domain protein [Lichtheimia corymbifera JMRC:FSU:9682]|uniref:Duf159 domain protein n=1 Tax=Lichtheimia corymbifera JMRC:FSU:9682 TaxID=1263082 RepID=A0A068S5D5_9FUNG|nr:duf159 domain protein [Lichtheimia corymbifera JMRC:FSU:9682]